MFGRKAKIRKAVDRALASVDAEDDVADHAPIEALPADLQAHAYYTLALALHEDERYAAARVTLERALAVAPDEMELHRLAGAIAAELGDGDGAIEAQRRIVASHPDDHAAIGALAEQLIAADRLDEVIALLQPLRADGDPELDTRLAEALFVQGKTEDALAILDEVCETYDAQMKRVYGYEWQALRERAAVAERLRADAYAELHGREATIELAAAAGKLDATAGVNYRLLGARLAATSDRLADELVLQDPDATEARGRAVLEAKRAAGLVLIGSAQLRRGDVGVAKQTFERASEADGRCFAAFLGIGAALDHERHSFHRRAARLAHKRAPSAELAGVVPDLAALTEPERRVVWASAEPLVALLPVLGERDVTIRILPIDVRATDVGLFADAANQRAADDQRSYDAITGMATHGGAIAKIEELLDIVSDGGWTFAHELAHLAFFHMTDDQRAPLLEIYERATEVGYANIGYALKNPDEFFAVSYTDYLRDLHGLPGVPIADDVGIQQALMSYFASLYA